MKMKRAIASIVFCFAVFGINAQETKIMSFSECLNHAVKCNPQIKKALLDEENNKYQKMEARSYLFPQVSAFGQYEYFNDIPTQLLPGDFMGRPGVSIPAQFGKKQNSTGGLEAGQLLYNQTYFEKLKSVSTACELASLATLKTEEDVIIEVAKNFYNILLSYQYLKIIDENLHKIGELLKIAESHYKNDLAKKTDVDRVSISISNLETQRENLQYGIKVQNNYMKLLLDLPIDSEFMVDTTVNLNVNEFLFVGGEPDLSQRIDCKLISKQKELYIGELKSYKATYLPSLTAFGRYSFNAQRDEFNFLDKEQDWYKMSLVGLKLSVPIFDGHAKHAKVQQAIIALNKLEIDDGSNSEYISMEYDNTKAQLKNSLASIDVQEKNVGLATEVYEQIRLQYLEGLAPLTDLLNAETALRESKIIFNQQLLNYKLAELGLLKAKGELRSYCNELIINTYIK